MSPRAPVLSGARVVAIGGGHGLAMTLLAVAPWSARLTAVVSTADDGGSSGRIRECWDVPALGDLRRCLAALAGADGVWGRLLERRFDAGEMHGHPVGNLVLLGLTEELGDLQAACDELGRVAGIDRERVRVVPVTDATVELRGRTLNGETVSGQVAVAQAEDVREVWVHPEATRASPSAMEAIDTADLVVLGPGSLYTSVLAASVVGDVRRALADAPGRIVYVANLRADGETTGYDVGRHVAALRRHGIHPEVVVAQRDGLAPGDVAADRDVELVLADVARSDGLVHDPEALGKVLAALLA